MDEFENQGRQTYEDQSVNPDTKTHDTHDTQHSIFENTQNSELYSIWDDAQNMEDYRNPNGYQNRENASNLNTYQNQENVPNSNTYQNQENVPNPNTYQNPNSSEQAGYYAYGQMNGASGAYTDTGENRDGLYRPAKEQAKPAGQGGGIAGKIARCIALALTFGLVAGLSFAGSMHLFGKITGRDTTGTSGLSKDSDSSLSGGNLHIVEATEVSEPTSGQKQSASGAVTDVSDIVEQTMPSIVSITTIARTQVPSFFFGYSQEYESEGCGSGIIISQDEEYLYIATNNHVVDGAQTLTVLFSDGSTADAQIKGCDSSSDLAVVSVALSGIEDETKQTIRVATFGDSSTLKIGQTAIAIGNALGYGQSVTTGVISALDREVTVTNEMDGSSITNALVQTSAAINPGNSGGALLDANGEVIGITSVKYSETSVEGMGYAIPSKTAIPIIKQLITREVVTGADTAYLGISGVDVSQDMSDIYNMPQGVYIAQVVEGSGASNAGLMQGDIIVRFDGRNVKTMDEVQELLRYLPAGTSVEVTVQRAQNGEYVEKTVDVVLGSKK